MAITPQDVRDFISDTPQKNLLLDNEEEYSDVRITLASRLAVDTFNVMPPRTRYEVDTFPYDSVLLYGTLSKLFEGQAALAARNHMSYSDGGVSLPIEERHGMYSNLAATYGQLFTQYASRVKVENNMNDGWGEVGSDYSMFPNW